jgi:putative transposase
MGARDHPDLSCHAYFITTTTRERLRLLADDSCARLFVAELLALRGELGFLLLSYVVMPDHVHLMVVPGPSAGLAKTMQYVKGRFARRLNARSSSQGNVWQPRYYERAIRDEASLRQAIEYIEENPVKAGLASAAALYAYSSASQPTGDLEGFLSGAAMAGWPG